MGACLATEKAARGMVIGTHGSTYGGNPLACAAGQAVLDVVLEEGFLDQVKTTGERLRGALEQLIPNHDHLFDSVRGDGVLLGLKINSDRLVFVAHLRATPDRKSIVSGKKVSVRVDPGRGRPHKNKKKT